MQELKGRNVELEKLLREGGGGNAAPQSSGLDDPNTTYSLRHLEEVERNNPKPRLATPNFFLPDFETFPSTKPRTSLLGPKV